MSEKYLTEDILAGGIKPALPFLNVYRWTTKLSTEQKENMAYIWPEEVKSLLRRLTHTQGNNVAVIGLQGSGKTAARIQLYTELASSNRSAQSRTISVKWNGPQTIEKTLWESFRYDREIYLQVLHRPLWEKLQGDHIRDGYAVPEALDSHMRKTALTKNETISVRKWIFGSNDEKVIHTVMIAIPKLEEILGRRKTSEVRREVARYQTQNYKNILIDFQDYDKKSRGQMRKDLKDFGEWWEQICNVDNEYAQEPNIVIFWQEELWGDHFTFGKWDIVRLQPFNPIKLREYYEGKFGSCDPFIPPALEYVAGLARGIFRWYKKYLRICLDKWYDLREKEAIESLITKDNINSWITTQQLTDDWDRELTTLFPRSRFQRHKAVSIIRYLNEHGDTSQLKIQKKFYGEDTKSKTACSRLLTGLEEFGYISRTPHEHTKTVSLRLPIL